MGGGLHSYPASANSGIFSVISFHEVLKYCSIASPRSPAQVARSISRDRKTVEIMGVLGNKGRLQLDIRSRTLAKEISDFRVWFSPESIICHSRAFRLLKVIPRSTLPPCLRNSKL